jgi:hypothetical protein
LEQPRNDINEGALSATSRPDDADGLPGSDLQRHVSQRGFVYIEIAEFHCLQPKTYKGSKLLRYTTLGMKGTMLGRFGKSQVIIDVLDRGARET